MNTYLIPIYDGRFVYIEKIVAKNLESAKEQFINEYLPDESPVPADWEDFTLIMNEDCDYTIGEFYEISEF